MRITYAEMLLLLSNKDLCEFFQIPLTNQCLSIINPREVISIIAQCEDVKWQEGFCGFVSADAYDAHYESVGEVEVALDELEDLFGLAEKQPEKVGAYLKTLDEEKKAKILQALMYQLLVLDAHQV